MMRSYALLIADCSGVRAALTACWYLLPLAAGAEGTLIARSYCGPGEGSDENASNEGLLMTNDYSEQEIIRHRVR